MNKKRLILLVVCLVVFAGFILLTSPYHLPLLLVVVPGVAFIIGVHILLTAAIKKTGMSAYLRRLTVNILTIILSILAILLSVGQLTFRDFSLLFALALMGMFYISRIQDRPDK